MNSTTASSTGSRSTAAPRIEIGALSRLLALSASGIGLGFTLSMVGFTRFEEVHAMFTFTDLRLFMVFVFGVVLTGLGFLGTRQRGLPRKHLHRGTLPGAVLFGIGWALCGACPGVVLAQLGEGQAHALVIALGVGSGTVLYRHVHGRYLRWDTGSC